MIKEAEILVSVGSDSHDVSSLDHLDDPIEAIKNYSLQKNLTRLINKIAGLE